MGDQHGDQVLIDSDVVQEFWVYTRKPTEMKKKICKFFTCIQRRQNLKRKSITHFSCANNSGFERPYPRFYGQRKNGSRIFF